MNKIYEGGCLCGQVRYTLAGEPLMVAACHCRNCQRQSGAPFSVVWGVADSAFAQTGETREFTDQGDSGAVVHRLFCPHCGSPIRSRAEAMPGVSFVKAGTLDAPEALAPAFETYCERAWEWMPALAPARYPLAYTGELA